MRICPGRDPVNHSWLGQVASLATDECKATRTCTKCKETKSVDAYHRAPGISDGRRAVCKSCMNAYYRSREDKYKETRKAYLERTREKRAAQCLKNRCTPHGQASALWKTAQQRSKNKSLEFSLPREWVVARVVNGKCEVTGVKFDLSKRGERYASPLAPSIDRIHPKLGYIPDNCRMVIWAYNAAKGNGTDEHVLIMAKALVERSERP